MTAIRVFGVLLLLYSTAIVSSSVYIWPSDFLTDFDSLLVPRIFADYPWINATFFLFLSLFFGFHFLLINLINPRNERDTRHQLYFIKGVDYVWYGLGSLGVALLVLDIQIQSYASKAREIEGTVMGIRLPQYEMIDKVQSVCGVINSDNYRPSHAFLGTREINNAKRFCAKYSETGFNLSKFVCDDNLQRIDYGKLWLHQEEATPNREYLLVTIYCSSVRLENEGISRIAELKNKYNSIDKDPFKNGFLFIIFPLGGIALRLVKTTIEFWEAIKS